MAGIVHFAAIFRYMEEAEHAAWRAAGMSIVNADSGLKWPRVSATCDFKSPLWFEDEFEVLTQMAKVTPRTIQWSHTIVRGDTIIATGSVTAACVRKQPDGSLKAVEIPSEILDRLRRAAGGP